MSYVPLSQRDKPDPAFDGPHEGVPPWLVEPVRGLVAIHIGNNKPGTRSMLASYEAAAHVASPLAGATYPGTAVQARIAQDGAYALGLADYLLIHQDFQGHQVTAFRRALVAGGSCWRVVSEGAHHKLERAEPVDTAGVVAAIRPVSERVGKLLDTARSAVYGRNANPNVAYQLAVEAVEIAAHPVVTPNNADATLGSVNSALRQAPDSKFSFLLDGKPEGAIGAKDAALPVMEALWRTQRRHGTDNRDPVTQAQAQAAYLAAVAVCGWFLGGAVGNTKV